MNNVTHPANKFIVKMKNMTSYLIYKVVFPSVHIDKNKHCHWDQLVLYIYNIVEDDTNNKLISMIDKTDINIGEISIIQM